LVALISPFYPQFDVFREVNPDDLSGKYSEASVVLEFYVNPVEFPEEL